MDTKDVTEQGERLGAKSFIQDWFKENQPKDYDAIMAGDKCPICGDEDMDIECFGSSEESSVSRFSCRNGHKWCFRNGNFEVAPIKK
jgi:hypothetical protein